MEYQGEMAGVFYLGIGMVIVDVVIVDQGDVLEGMGKKVMRIGRLVDRGEGVEGHVIKRTGMWNSE